MPGRKEESGGGRPKRYLDSHIQMRSGSGGKGSFAWSVYDKDGGPERPQLCDGES